MLLRSETGCSRLPGLSLGCPGRARPLCALLSFISFLRCIWSTTSVSLVLTRLYGFGSQTLGSLCRFRSWPCAVWPTRAAALRYRCALKCALPHLVTPLRLVHAPGSPLSQRFVLWSTAVVQRTSDGRALGHAPGGPGEIELIPRDVRRTSAVSLEASFLSPAISAERHPHSPRCLPQSFLGHLPLSISIPCFASCFFVGSSSRFLPASSSCPGTPL